MAAMYKPSFYFMSKLGTIRNVDCTYAKWYIAGHATIPMRSGYEVAYAHYLTDKGIFWQYEPMTFYIGPSKHYLGRTYTPDFWLPAFNTLVELKGRYSRSDKLKVATFRIAYPQYQHIVLKGKGFRDLIGRRYMEMGGTAPKVLQAGLLSTLNSRIVYR